MWPRLLPNALTGFQGQAPRSGPGGSCRILDPASEAMKHQSVICSVVWSSPKFPPRCSRGNTNLSERNVNHLVRTATWEGAVIFGNTNVPLSLIPGNSFFQFPNWKILGQIFPTHTEKCNKGFPDGASGKEPICQCWRHKRGDTGSIPGSGRSIGGEHGNPLQDSCLGIPWTEEPGGLSPWGSKDSATYTPQKCNRRLDLLKWWVNHTFISLESSSSNYLMIYLSFIVAALEINILRKMISLIFIMTFTDRNMTLHKVNIFLLVLSRYLGRSPGRWVATSEVKSDAKPNRLNRIATFLASGIL